MMEHPKEFFSSHWKEVYSAENPSSSSQAALIPWVLDHVEGWYHLVSTFFVPAGHVGPYKFASGVTLPSLSPREAHERAEKQREKKEEEEALKKSLEEARKRLNSANDALTKINEDIPSRDAMQA